VTLAERLRAAVLPGEPPGLRGDWDFNDDELGPSRNLKEAAVLIGIVSRPHPTLLLTRRLDTLRSHAGQVAFPGGRIDPEDAGPVEAALREAHEEVALPPSEVEVLGVTDAYETGSGYRITPVIGILPPDLPLVPAADEVASLFEVPLDFVLDPANHKLHEAEWQGLRRRYYAIDWETHHIWGATAGMIVNLSRRLA
jgi:8-oxo-dGTP pyrophosphatase MutT (NUDIX family)